MKKLLVALGFTMAAMSAQASTLSLAPPVSGPSSIHFTEASSSCPDCGHDVITGATDGLFGTLSIDSDASFVATFLGSEAGNTNFYVGNGLNVMSNKSSNVGDTFAFDVSAGAINFGFYDQSTGVSAANIGDNINKIAYITNKYTTNEMTGERTYDYNDASGNPFAFLIGFNDSGSLDGDYDDYVVGVNAVPVPAALPLMASALGLFGVSRRKSKKAA